MKRLLYILTLIFNICYGQMAINTTTPNPSTILHVEGNNKGITIPKIQLATRSDISAFGGQQPKESLLIYNPIANDSVTKALYFYNGTKWDYMFNDHNIDVFKNMIRYYSKSSTNSYNNASFYNTEINIGQINDLNGWTVINEVTEDLEITKPVNELEMMVSGTVYSNSNSTTSGTVLLAIAAILETKTGNTFTQKIIDVTPINLKISANSNCNFKTFKFIGVSKDLPMTTSNLGDYTKLKFAFKNLSNNSQTHDIYYTKKTPSNQDDKCQNLSNDEAKVFTNIILKQPKPL